MRASIVIASLNEGFRLWKTVQSCIDTTKGLDYEVVVADDRSRDGSIEELQRRFPQVRVIKSPRRRGCSPTKDAAARAARGDTLVFLDGHCNPEPGAIARLVADVERLAGKAIVTPSVPALNELRWKNSTRYVGYGCRLELDTLNGNWMHLEDMLVHPGLRSPRFYKSPTFIGCCLAMSRRLYKKLWGFDRDMRFWGVEDMDLGLKAWLMGHLVLHDPKATIGHRFRAAFDNYSVPAEHVLANKLRMARKNFMDAVWNDWLKLAREREPDWLWHKAWRIFQKRRDGLERERSYLLRHRAHDEFWYATEFGLAWPKLKMCPSAASRSSAGADD